MLKFTSIVGYTSCGTTYIESFFTILGQTECINVLNYKHDVSINCEDMVDGLAAERLEAEG